MFVERILAKKARDVEQWPVKSNRASEAGHPCTRYLVYNRTRYEEKALPSGELKLIFDLGNDIEERVLKDLKDAGIMVRETQRSFEWKEYQITGSIDAKIYEDGNVYPCEIKSMSPFVFNKVNCIEDMTKGKYVYLTKYPTQLNLYLLMSNCSKGLFILKEKVSGKMKEIWMDIDYDLGEATLKKLEDVNAHIAAGTVPDRCEYNENICGTCAFTHICLPERIGKEVEIIDNDELKEALARWHELKEPKREYDELDSFLKKSLEGKDKLIVGDYYVTGSWREKTVYNVPDDIRNQYISRSKYWVKKIQTI